MKKVKYTVETDKWVDHCPHCGDIIEGRTETQCMWNLSVHILAKHKGMLDKKEKAK